MTDVKFDNDMTVYDLAQMMMKKFEENDRKLEKTATKDDLVKLELRLGERMGNLERRLETRINYIDKKLERGLELLEHRTTVLKDVIEQDLNTKVIW